MIFKGNRSNNNTFYTWVFKGSKTLAFFKVIISFNFYRHLCFIELWLELEWIFVMDFHYVRS